MVFPIKAALRNRLAKRLRVPEIPTAIGHLKDLGFEPRCVFDVGAYKGEFAELCLRSWPTTKVVCFEVLADKVKDLEFLEAKDPRIKVVPTLLGAQVNPAVRFHELETASSILEEQFQPLESSVSWKQMQTIDSFVAEKEGKWLPELLKIDVQGYELEVLKGAEKTLTDVQVILAELNFLDIHKCVPLMAEVIAWLNERQWVAYDICGLTRRPLDHALWQADFIFVPQASPLRSNKHWAATHPN